MRAIEVMQIAREKFLKEKDELKVIFFIDGVRVQDWLYQDLENKSVGMRDFTFFRSRKEKCFYLSFDIKTNK